MSEYTRNYKKYYLFRKETSEIFAGAMSDASGSWVSAVKKMLNKMDEKELGDILRKAGFALMRKENPEQMSKEMGFE